MNFKHTFKNNLIKGLLLTLLLFISYQSHSQNSPTFNSVIVTEEFSSILFDNVKTVLQEVEGKVIKSEYYKLSTYIELDSANKIVIITSDQGYNDEVLIETVKMDAYEIDETNRKLYILGEGYSSDSDKYTSASVIVDFANATITHIIGLQNKIVYKRIYY